MIKTRQHLYLTTVLWIAFCIALSYIICFPIAGVPQEPKFLITALLCPAVLAPTGAWVFGTLMLRLHHTTEELRQASQRDHLTGIYNRQFLVGQLGSIGGTQPAVMLMADIDHFKRINDTYGHFAGDQVITYVANCLAEHCRDGDVVSRFGGEEFAVVMIGASQEHGLNAAERMRQAVAQANLVFDGRRVPITISIGVAARHGSQDANDVLHAADNALYEAKGNGRDRVELAA
ncbi:MAG: GGDEF domain-containing protein [Shimia sp.]|uniref:GGDEF domain-containing protein n=1 Tax=Shimia sp. TaxID=1954381 RepID=UPI0040596325